MKFCFLLLVSLMFSAQVHADQLAWLDEKTAQDAQHYVMNYMKHEPQLVLWCACCDQDTPNQLTLTEVTYQENDWGFFELILLGTDADGNTIETAVDLAYVHVLKKGEWHCLGKELNLSCDPCTKPFLLN